MEKTMRWGRLLMVCAFSLVVFFVGRSRLNAGISETRAQETALQVTLTRLQKEQGTLRSELKEVGTDNYIENRARTDYQYLKPGELRFEIANPDALYTYTEQELQIRMEEIGE